MSRSISAWRESTLQSLLTSVALLSRMPKTRLTGSRHMCWANAFGLMSTRLINTAEW